MKCDQNTLLLVEPNKKYFEGKAFKVQILNLDFQFYF